MRGKRRFIKQLWEADIFKRCQSKLAFFEHCKNAKCKVLLSQLLFSLSTITLDFKAVELGWLGIIYLAACGDQSSAFCSSSQKSKKMVWTVLQKQTRRGLLLVHFELLLLQLFFCLSVLYFFYWKVNGNKLHMTAFQSLEFWQKSKYETSRFVFLFVKALVK